MDHPRRAHGVVDLPVRHPRGLTLVAPAPPVQHLRHPAPWRWLARRHGVVVEIVTAVAAYFGYDSSRGLASGGRRVAVTHAHDLFRWEGDAGLAVERSIQHLAGRVPGLLDVFGFGYAAFHLGVTVSVLAWLYIRHHRTFVRTRTALLVASGLALLVFIAFPVAPPRMAGIGVADTLGLGKATADSGVLSFLYNPYAALPSIHVAYAVIVGVAIWSATGHRAVKLVGVAYPAFVAVEVVATGNHFVFDVIAGALVATVASVLGRRLVAKPPETDPTSGARILPFVRRGEDPAPHVPEDRWAGGLAAAACGVAPGDLSLPALPPRR